MEEEDNVELVLSKVITSKLDEDKLVEIVFIDENGNAIYHYDEAIELSRVPAVGDDIFICGKGNEGLNNYVYKVTKVELHNGGYTKIYANNTGTKIDNLKK